jgi:hypothetical protein
MKRPARTGAILVDESSHDIAARLMAEVVRKGQPVSPTARW